MDSYASKWFVCQQADVHISIHREDHYIEIRVTGEDSDINLDMFEFTHIIRDTILFPEDWHKVFKKKMFSAVNLATKKFTGSELDESFSYALEQSLYHTVEDVSNEMFGYNSEDIDQILIGWLLEETSDL